jgi:hypothetical protein
MHFAVLAPISPTPSPLPLLPHTYAMFWHRNEAGHRMTCMAAVQLNPRVPHTFDTRLRGTDFARRMRLLLAPSAPPSLPAYLRKRPTPLRPRPSHSARQEKRQTLERKNVWTRGGGDPLPHHALPFPHLSLLAPVACVQAYRAMHAKGRASPWVVRRRGPSGM